MPDRSGNTIHIVQGEFAIGRNFDQRISTLLGSCVSVCLWDPNEKIGGMNHMLLPESIDGSLQSASYGATAMEQLINALLRNGAERSRLRSKVFGGASMITGLSDVGERNCAFARGYLHAEEIPIDGESLGGDEARQIRFWPTTGRVQLRSVGRSAVQDRPVETTPEANDVELF